MNPMRGDVEFAVGGETYTMRFGGSALLAVEDAFAGKAWNVVLQDIAAKSTANEAIPVRDIANLVRCALVWHHPDITIEEAAELAMIPEAQEAMGRAMTAAFPQAQGVVEDDAVDPRKTPQTKRRGTGTRSGNSGSRRAAI